MAALASSRGGGADNDKLVWTSDAGSITSVAAAGRWAAAGDKGGRIRVWAPREGLWGKRQWF